MIAYFYKIALISQMGSLLDSIYSKADINVGTMEGLSK